MRITWFLSLILISHGCRMMNTVSVAGTAINSPDSSLQQLALVIKTADTVLLISHTGMILDKKENKIIEPRVVIKNKINRKIIHEQKILTQRERDTLISILLIAKPDTDSLTAKCWDPHHAICIIKKTKLSYIDLCFHCAGLATSVDLRNIYPFGELKWTRLLFFFSELGLLYELPGKILPGI